MSRRHVWFPLIFSCLALIGCSDPYAGRQAVSGTVTLKDQPLKTGIVMFEPLDGQDTGGSVMLSDGKYELPRQGGLKAGKYRVRITAGDGKTATNPVNPDEPPGPGGGTNIVSKDLVPASWNTQSKQEVTVKGDGPNTLNFDIK
jgi:hypothetical protein